LKTYDLVELATRNLRESVLRNSLTTIGIAVGVASLVAMLSLGIGLQHLANLRLERSGLFDTVVVFPRRGMEGFGPARAENALPPRSLDESARQEIARLAGVAEAYPEIRVPTEVRYHDKPFRTVVEGLPPSAAQSAAMEGIQGRFFSKPDAAEAILQSDFAKDLDANTARLIGRPLTLVYAESVSLRDGERSRSVAKSPPRSSAAAPAAKPPSPSGFSVVRKEAALTIVGITESQPNAGFERFGRARVFVPLALAEKMNPPQVAALLDAPGSGGSGPAYATVIARVADLKNIEPVENSIKRMGFNTFSLQDATRNLRQFFAVLDLFLGIFGSLALAVASLGIINTLVMAILERRREIGILKALGASDRDVRGLFFAEAGAMGIAGGAAGVALGWTIGRIINFGANVYLQRQNLPPQTIWLVPWWLVAGAIAFSLVVSLLAGLYPAARAARLDPVQTLRYE
jgi:putative ABC transport system permease protein